MRRSQLFLCHLSRTIVLRLLSFLPSLSLSGKMTQSSTLPQAVIAPPPVVQAALIQRLGDINVGRTQAVSPAPEVPLAEQHTSLARNSNVGTPVQPTVPPPPSLEATGATDAGRVIAL